MIRQNAGTSIHLRRGRPVDCCRHKQKGHMMNRKPLVAANWKMHKTVGEAVSFAETLQREVGPLEDREVVLAPPFTALSAVKGAMRQNGYRLSAQTCHWADKGAFTGEVSVTMLKDIGCDYVIVGHSERRHLFGEADEIVKKKVDAVFAHEILPILCVGEVLEEREGGKTFDVVGRQVDSGIHGLSLKQAEGLVIAYEPVWAIGTGKTATPAQAEEVHLFIRERLGSRFDKMIANRVRILYGGSVKADNVDSLMSEPDIDGLLVGGASLDAESFKRIVQYR